MFLYTMANNDSAYHIFLELKEWTNTMIERHGHIIIAHANNEKQVVKAYKAALSKLQRCLSIKIKETKDMKDKTLKSEYKMLHHNIVVLNKHVRNELL